MPPAKNPYEVLRLPPTATQQDIDDAYGRLKGLLADNALASYGMMDPEQVEALAQELDSAYGSIGEATRRAAFDQGQHPWAIEAALGHDVSTSAPHLPQSSHPGTEPSSQKNSASNFDPREQHSAVVSGHRLALSAFYVPDEALPKTTEALDGALLQRLRLAAQASLDDVSHVTKINRRYLAAIENDDFAQLPAGVYVRGFVGEYLRALGLTARDGFDSKALLQSFIGRYQVWRQKS